MSDKEPGQYLWQEIWGALSYSWETTTQDTRDRYANIEAAVRADEREKVIEECAKVVEDAFWGLPKSHIEIAAAIRALGDKP